MTQSKGTAKDREILRADKPGLRNWRKNVAAVLGFLAILYPAWGVGERKIDQLVVDVSNVWRNKLGRAVADALLRFGTLASRFNAPEALLDEKELEMFLEHATESLWRRIEQVVDLLEMIKATHFLLGFDAWTQPRVLGNKGRVGDATADAALSKKEIGKMLGLMRKNESQGYTWTEGAVSDQLRKMRNNISEMLHQTDSSHELSRLLIA